MTIQYRVTTRNWNCNIQAIQVTKETEHMVTFVPPGDNRKDLVWTQRKISVDYRWFKELTDAKTYAMEFVKQKIEYHQGMIKDFTVNQVEIALMNEDPLW